MNSELIEETIYQAISSSNANLLRECIYAMKTATSEGEYFPEKCLALLLKLIEDKKFLELGGGWYFIMLLQTKWQSLPENEQQRVLPALQMAYQEFEQITPQLIEEAIAQAIASGEEMQMKECAHAISATLSMRNDFPEHYFELILRLLDQKRFLKANGSWHLLRVLGTDWELLSDSQKDRLLPLLETRYGDFSDWMSCFVISEFLGQYFADERAFEILCRLKKLPSEEPRSLLPHALEHIVRDSQDRGLAKKAYAELLEMQNDPSLAVRNEVDTSLQRIAKNLKN